MRLKTLGGLALEPSVVRRPKPLLLLAYLSVEGSKEKRHLQELFWPEAEDPAVNLRMSLSRLREAGKDLFSSDERTVSSQLQSDIAELQAALEKRDTQKLLELYQGEFLAGFSLPDWGTELEEWVYSTREFLAAQVRSAFMRQGEQIASGGDFAGAALWAERAYRIAGGTPEPEDLERLYRLLLAGDSGLSSEVRKQAKDYDLELNQIAAEAKAHFYTAPQGSQAAPPVLHNLPTPKTSFVGRDPELLELSSVLEEQGRLLTLLGPGGIGKTRLALQFAYGQLAEGRFKDGIYFVVLDALGSAEQIPQTLAGVLNIQPSAKQDLMQTLEAHLGQKQILLVLDNFEHLMDGALLVSQLLEACPNLKILVTSRERLNLEEEFVLPLRGLHVPTQKLGAAEAEYNDAVRLFVQRAKRARLDFDLTPENLPQVLQICQIVEGSPLGIELATVWLRTLSPQELVDEILYNLGRLESPSRNLPERHHSLQAVFEHSWQLLNPKEQAVLSKLTAFIGGFTREAASAVTDATIPILTSLVDKSMLRQSEGRYDFHVLLYQFAREKLSESSYTAVAEQHARYFLSLAEAASPQLYGPDKTLWLKRLAQEHDNFRAALQWATQHHGQLGLALAAALKNFWMIQGHIQEGLGWLERLLVLDAASAQSVPALLRANALTGAAWLAHAEDDFAKANQLFEESATLRRSLGQGDGLAAKRVNEAMQARSNGEYQQAAAILEETLAQHRIEGNRHSIGDDGIGLSLSRLALVRCEQGQYAEATALWEECLNLHQSLGDRGGIATALLGLSDVAREQADTPRLNQLGEESRALFEAMGEQWGMGFALNNLAIAAYLEGDLNRAAQLSEESVRLMHTIWGGAPVAEVLSTLGLVRLARGETEAARAALAESLEKLWAYGPRWLVAVCLEGFAGLRLQMGLPEPAAQLLAVATAWREKISVPLSPLRQSMQRRWLETTQTLLGKSWESVWQAGLELSVEQGIALALQTPSYKKTPNPKLG